MQELIHIRSGDTLRCAEHGLPSGHCKNAYIKEFERKNYPDEYRKGTPIFEPRRAKP